MPNGVILMEIVDRRWCDTIVVEGVGVRLTSVQCDAEKQGVMPLLGVRQCEPITR